MPMHDWTRVTPNDYHDFHFSWIAAIKGALNNGVLPPDYFALADHTTPPFIPDVVTLTTADPSPNGPPAGGGGGVAVAADPEVTVVATEPARKRPVRRRVSVQRARDRRIVAVIEVVSPGDKAKKVEFGDLVGKSVGLLREGVHVLLIDPFPPTRRDPHGLHAAVWKELTGKRFAPPADKPLTLAAYAARGDDRFSAFAEPTAVGDALEPMPLFLTPDRHVRVPLEPTYLAAWQAFPAGLRAVVDGR